MPETDPPGIRLARGVCRFLYRDGIAGICELQPARGLRVDVMALTPKGEIWIVECKSGRADFRADGKWTGYLDWCDRFFWAVDESFPLDILPEETGIILTDAFDAEIARMAPKTPLAPARRTRLTRDFARAAATRLLRLTDPFPGAPYAPD